jgi:hypothetical protein
MPELPRFYISAMKLHLVLATAAVIGCTRPQTVPQSQQTTPEVTSLVATQRVEYIDTVARETMIVQHPNGTLFVGGYGGPWAGSDTT